MVMMMIDNDANDGNDYNDNAWPHISKRVSPSSKWDNQMKIQYIFFITIGYTEQINNKEVEEQKSKQDKHKCQTIKIKWEKIDIFSIIRCLNWLL